MSDTVRAGERELIEGREHQYEPGTTCWCGQANHILEHETTSKALPTESTVERLAEEFHNVYQDEARRQGDVRHKDAYADLPENIKEFDRVLARHVLARGVSEYEPGPTEMYLCEINHLILHSDQPYIFRKHPDCYGCNKYLAHGTPAEHNPARAPHNKFASLWCDACPRPTSGTPAPRCRCGHSKSQHIEIPANPGQLSGCQECNCGTYRTWCNKCGFQPCDCFKVPASADETLAMPNEKRKESLWKIWRKGNHNFDWLYHKAFADGLAARPSGTQAAAPATTPNCLCGHSQSNHVSIPAHPGQLPGCQDCNCPQFAQAAAPGGKEPK